MSPLGHFNYWIFALLAAIGLYIAISRGNLVKKIVGLNIMQASVFLLYISVGAVWGGAPPIITEGNNGIFANALPHVLILTAIVVGIATTAIALALIVRIKESFGTIEEDEIMEAERAYTAALQKGDDG